MHHHYFDRRPGCPRLETIRASPMAHPEHGGKRVKGHRLLHGDLRANESHSRILCIMHIWFSGALYRHLVVGHDPRLLVSLSSRRRDLAPPTQAMGSYSASSDSLNQRPISLVAESKASEAWMRFRLRCQHWPFSLKPMKASISARLARFIAPVKPVPGGQQSVRSLCKAHAQRASPEKIQPLTRRRRRIGLERIPGQTPAGW